MMREVGMRLKEVIQSISTLSMKTRNRCRKNALSAPYHNRRKNFMQKRMKNCCLCNITTFTQLVLQWTCMYEDVGLILQNLITCCRFWGSPWESLWSIRLLQPGRSRVSVSVKWTSGLIDQLAIEREVPGYSPSLFEVWYVPLVHNVRP